METASGMAAGSILTLSVTCGDSSPKGRALGKTRSFAVLPKPLPLTDFPRSGEDGEAKKGNKVDLRSKDGEGEDVIQWAVTNPSPYPLRGGGLCATMIAVPPGVLRRILHQRRVFL